MSTAAADAAAHRLAAIREELPATRHSVYLNAGTCGPLPRRSAAAMQHTMAAEVERGRIGRARFDDVRQLLEQARTRIARWLHARPDQIALTARTTDGLNIALWGLRWAPGDQILTTDHEHAGLLAPLAAIARRFGVEVRFVSLGDCRPETVLANVQGALTPRTRLLAFSHVLWTNGAVLPLPELVGVAHRAGARVLVDGAQAAGVIGVDVRRCPVDFYALPGQKWFCGPEGTGALYVADDALAVTEPAFAGYASAAAYDPRSPFFLPVPGAARFETGVPFPPAIAGLVASLTWLEEELGWTWIGQRTAALANHLAERLEAIDAVEVLTPRPNAGPSSGLVAFRLPGIDAETAVERLVARGFYVRSIPAPHAAVRAAPGFYNTVDELDALADAVSALVAGSPDHPESRNG